MKVRRAKAIVKALPRARMKYPCARFTRSDSAPWPANDLPGKAGLAGGSRDAGFASSGAEPFNRLPPAVGGQVKTRAR
jgi:hypothetical protein